MNLKILLALSLAANLALGFFALRKSSVEKPVAENQVAASVAVPHAKKALETSVVVAGGAVSASAPHAATKRFDWQSVESPDYKQYIANLRAIGCPEETIKDIILADVNKLYDQKKKAVRGPAKKFEYWKGGN